MQGQKRLQLFSGRSWIEVGKIIVYTKNRDFRMIGSCKRKGSSVAKHIRWLWMLNAPHILTKENFLNSLLQSDTGKRVKRYIVRIVDTINNGIPSSSSLKTVTSIVTTRKARTNEKASSASSASSSYVSSPVVRLTPAAMQMRQLETYKVLAESENAKIIFLPGPNSAAMNLDNVTANLAADMMK